MRIRLRHLTAGLAGLGIALVVLPVQAQSVPEAAKTRATETSGQITKTRRSQNLNAEADALPAIEFSDVLAAPDDPAVNLRYAKEMVLQGKIQLAAATVERILILYPDADDVRLLYAILLYRMDVIDDAKAQLDVLEAANPSGAIKAEIAKYRKLIEQRQNPLKRSASFAAGMHYDKNRNAYPDSGNFLVGGVVTPGTSEEIDDWGRFALGAVQISRDTGKQQLQEVSADAAYMYDDQVEVSAIDVQALLLNVGALYKSQYGDFLPGAHATIIDLDRDRYSRDYAVSMRWQKPVYKSTIAMFIDARHGWRAYNNTLAAPFNDEQDGNYQRLEVGGRKVIDPTTWFNVSLTLNRIDASADFQSYDGYALSADITKILPRSTFLNVAASVEKQFYEGPDGFVSPLTRKDTDSSVDVTYGIPLATIGDLVFGDGALPEQVRPILLNLSVAYQNSDSNLLNYDYHNYRTQFMFNRGWDF